MLIPWVALDELADEALARFWLKPAGVEWFSLAQKRVPAKLLKHSSLVRLLAAGSAYLDGRVRMADFCSMSDLREPENLI